MLVTAVEQPRAQGRHPHDLVKIHGHAVGPAHAADQVFVRVTENRWRAMGAIDVKPQSLLLRKVRQHVEVIVGPAARCASTAHDRHHAPTRFVHRLQSPLQTCLRDVVALISVHQPHAVRAPAHDAHRSVHAIMGLVRHQHRALTVIAILPRVVRLAGMPPTGGQQGHQIGQGAAVAHHPTTPFRQPHLLANLRHQHFLHGGVRGPHLINRPAIVQQVRDHAHQGAIGKRDRHLMPHVSGVLKAIGPLHHSAHQRWQSLRLRQPLPPKGTLGLRLCPRHGDRVLLALGAL